MSLVSVGLVRPTLIAQIVHKTLVGGSGGGADCWLYYFKPLDPDRLDFNTAFTGNFKANIATFNGVTGLDSNLSGLTLTNSPEAARTDASLLVWNKVDLSVTAMGYIVDDTFDGAVPNYAKDDVWYDIDMGKPSVPPTEPVESGQWTMNGEWN